MLMVSGSGQSEPLTPTLSPQGRGSEGSITAIQTPSPTSPLRGEVDAQRRVRGSVSRSRALRSNATDAERALWAMLRARQLAGHKFVRQLPVGPYFADFACREAALLIELDGGQHAGSTRDDSRTALLNAEGYAVLRFWNNEVLTNARGVAEAILEVLASRAAPAGRFAPAAPSPEGRGEKGVRAATTNHRSYRLTADLPRLVKE